MKEMCYRFASSDGEVVIKGFIASLLEQGEDWDIRCVNADMQAYHTAYYARMNARDALKQELAYWLDYACEDRLDDMPMREELAKAGIVYLHWWVKEVIRPLSDSEKLSTKMAIYLDDDSYLYKVEDTMVLFTQGGELFLDCKLHAFPSQLLSYAACSTIDALLCLDEIEDMLVWASMMESWLQYPPRIALAQIEFAIADVEALYSAYVENEKASWDAEKRKYYLAGQPQLRNFMPRLLARVQEECAHAEAWGKEYLTDKQYVVFCRYMQECQQYIKNHTKSRGRKRGLRLDAYWHKSVIDDSEKEFATSAIKKAARQKTNPAAALAKVVKELQYNEYLIKSLYPLVDFIDTVNALCGTCIKVDTFSKHFRK